MKPSAHRIEVKAMRLSHGLGLPLPQYQSEEAAGLDLMAAVPLTTPLRLLPGMRQLVPTGITVEIPPGYEGQVRPRSGLALNHGVTVLNSPGTIDSDYRGEIKVLLINLGRETFVVTRGQRIAQLVFQGVARAELIDVRAVAASRRGEAGFGSTGLAAAEAAKAPPAPRAPTLPTLMKAVPVADKPTPAAPVRPATPVKAAAPAAKPVAAVKTAPAAKPVVAPKPAPAAKAPPPSNDKPKKVAAAKTSAAKPVAAKKPSPKPQPAKLSAVKAATAKRPVASAAKPKAAARA